MPAPTMEDVAREAGVSRALVSLVFRGQPHVSERRRTAVLEAADRLGYRLNAAASSLASRQSRIIGLVVNDLSNPYLVAGTEALQERAESVGRRLILGLAKRDAEHEQAAIETLLQHRPDALILAGTVLPKAVLTRFGRQVPTLVMGRIVRDASVDCIAIDDARGAELVVEHLAGLGHSRILHVDGGGGAGAAPRRTGYRKTMTRLGLAEHIDVMAGDFTEQAGANAARQLLDRDVLPTAVFAADDLVALGVLDVFRGAGVAVPEDVSVVGFDDSTIARLQAISLTSVSQPVLHMSSLAIDAVLARLEDPTAGYRAVVVPPQLVIRGSSGTPRPATA
ncbi:MAG: putative LacI family transcriptional regulator [Frankiales bacterium]|nr:putative LacI family transcriptional regulator [Frankiales bacterium]